MTMKDDMLRRYVRYQNYAEELRAIASARTDNRARDDLMSVADSYDQMAVSLNSILKAKAALER
jgi:hypothetical protein